MRSLPEFAAQPRYLPHDPVRSPLDDVLRLVPAGVDSYATELYASEIGVVLERWCRALEQRDAQAIKGMFSPGVRAGSLKAARETVLRDRGAIRSVRLGFAAGTQQAGAQQGGSPLQGGAQLLAAVLAWVGEGARVDHAATELVSLEVVREPGGQAAGGMRVRSTVHLSLVLQLDPERREQRTATWATEWTREGTAGAWQLAVLEPQTEMRGTVRGPGFVDVTDRAFRDVASHTAQLRHGSDYWRTVLDGACGIDVYGNNGVAAGDYDGDGFDDLYVSQPAGLPNRLYRNRGDGTFEDVTAKAGVGVLDNTACALFADFRNVGLQDLLVVCGSGPLLFQNRGDGTFALKRDAFRFAQPPQGTFTHAAVADYDRDGRLDVYFCLYSYYLGLDQYHYPTPYFDARNGPPNFLMRNQGDGTFADVTAAAGLAAENDRYSFACAWGDSVEGRLPDLYVVNDFGRNNLYRSKGDGTFAAVSDAARVQDVGAGMSACWADVDGDGRQDLYVANMWSAAGQRVSAQPQFHAGATANTLELYRRHARGNALYRNRGDGTFTNTSEAAGVEVGRWAWGSDAWDFDQDGSQDLYVTNGYITAPRGATGEPGGQADLGSFFWRQVVGRSPDDTTPSLAYERGWNALNELIRTDSSWSGNERNVLFANNGDGTFCDVSGALNLDFLEDGRAFALADLDGDGRLEMVVKNRNAPQLRVVRNAMAEVGDTLVLRLRGTGPKGNGGAQTGGSGGANTGSNRDGIGAVVEVTVATGSGVLRQTRALQAGSGFLAQHTKELLFGLGSGTATASAVVHWPGGLVQRFADLPRNRRVTLTEGETAVQAVAFVPASQAYAGATGSPVVAAPEALPTSFGTWLIDPLKAPAFALPGLDGQVVSLESKAGKPVLLHLFASAGQAQEAQTQEVQLRALAAARVPVLAVCLDPPAAQDGVRAAVRRMRLPYPVLFATDEMAGVYNLIFRYLFDRRANLPLPTSFLLDGAGMVVKVYQGAVAAGDVDRDAAAMPTTREERVRRALPFAGTLYQGSFVRNDFTYGVAMFQHGYLDQAAASFEQVSRQRPDDAEAQYNLGTLSLRRNDLPRAKQYLQRTLELKPNYPEAWNNLGMMAAQQGQTAEAVHSFEQSLALRPGYATALENLGNLYRHERNFARAEEYLSRALQAQPDDPEANYSMGMLYAQQGQSAAAEVSLQKAIQYRPDYPEALNNLGVLYVRDGNEAAAEELFLRCVRLVPGFEGSYLNLARLYLARQDRAKARETLLQLLRLRPESAVGRQALQSLDGTP